MKKNVTGEPSPVNLLPDNLTDWERIRNMKDEDIVFDEDSPRTTEADWEGALIRIGRKVIGRYKGNGTPPEMESVTISFTPVVLEAFRASGPGWQERMDLALIDWLQSRKPEELRV